MTIFIEPDSVFEDNEIHLVKFSESSDDVSCAAILKHKDEIWTIAPCPAVRRLFFTTYSRGGKHGASLWKMPEKAFDGDGGLMDLEAQGLAYSNAAPFSPPQFPPNSASKSTFRVS